MNRTRTSIAVACLLLAAVAWAQPGAGRGMPRGMAGGPMAMSPAQVLGYLALNPDIDLTDQQLLDLRTGLRDVYQEQEEMRAERRSGNTDFRVMREAMTAAQEKVLAAVTAVLTAEQLDAYNQAMEAQRSSRGQGMRRGRN